MKRIFRHFTIDTFSLWAVSQLVSGMVFDRGIQTLIIAGIALSFASLIAKPVINLLLLPLNMITFGVFRWVSSAVTLYLVTLVIHDFHIERFSYSGFINKWIEIPSFNLEGAVAYIGFALILSIITSYAYWIYK